MKIFDAKIGYTLSYATRCRVEKMEKISTEKWMKIHKNECESGNARASVNSKQIERHLKILANYKDNGQQASNNIDDEFKIK